MICWDTRTYGWVYGSMGGSSQMTNLIKLELINIIWFCLKIYNLSRHPYLWVDGWVNGWAHVKPLKSNKSWPNWDNSIMDILDILLDILLKPPQPFIGLFFPCRSGFFDQGVGVAWESTEHTWVWADREKLLPLWSFLHQTFERLQLCHHLLL